MKDFQLLKKYIVKKSKIFLKKGKDYFLPLCLICLVVVSVSIDTLLQSAAKKKQLFSIPISQPSLSFYPSLSLVNMPFLSAEAAFIFDNDSKVVLFSKNADLRFSPASTTKIMTALVALDAFHMDDILQVKQSFSEGAVLGVVPGETFSFKSLLSAMLLPSANDVAHVIAENYPGGEDAFIAQMNEKAKILHLYNTRFGDPAGLEDDKNYTTAKDLARLASFAIENPIFKNVVATKEERIMSLDNMNDYILFNRNDLLGYSGVDGIKTGYTEDAMGVLVTSTIQHNHKIIMVVMRSQDRFGDTQRLLQLTANNLTFVPIHL